MAKSNSKSDSAKKQSPKLSPAQRRILQLLDDGVGIRRRSAANAPFYYRENQDDTINQIANTNTVSSLLSKNFIVQESYEHDGRKYYKLALTDGGRAALTPPASNEPKAKGETPEWSRLWEQLGHLYLTGTLRGRNGEEAFTIAMNDYTADRLTFIPGDYTNQQAREAFMRGWGPDKQPATEPNAAPLTATERHLLAAIAGKITDGFDEGLYDHLKSESRDAFDFLVTREFLVRGDTSWFATDAGRAALDAVKGGK